MLNATIYKYQQLCSSKINPRDAEILLAFVLGKSREFILAHPEITLSLWQKFHFKKLLRKRERGVPLAYLLGHKEFFGLNFLVNKYTLIPRPETEILVESVLENIENQTEKITLIDIGTGTGCIPISILKNSPKKIHAMATDISRRALRVARYNSKRNRVPITFLQGNLLKPIKKNITGNIIITANLPYLSAEQYNEESTIQYEPKKALIAAEQGLKLYRQLLQQIVEQKFTTPLTIFFEINPEQTTTLKKIIAEYFPIALVTIILDLSTRERVAMIEINKKAK